MRSWKRRVSLRCPVSAILLIGLATAGCGSGGVEDVCIQLASETVQIADQLVEIADTGGGIDTELACRFLANEIELLDEGCITESDLPEGTSRASLLAEQEDLDCPVD